MSENKNELGRKLGLTQLYLGTYVHYIKNGFQPYFRAFLCL